MSNFLNSPIGQNLPLQQLPLASKLEDKDKYGVPKWGRLCMDALESIGRVSFFDNAYLFDNYDIAEGNFNIKHYIDSNDMYDFTSSMAQELGVPNILKHYDITGKAVKLLIGEFLKRPDLFRFRDSSPEASNERLRVMSEMMKSHLQQKLQKEISQKLAAQGLDVNRDKFKNEQEQADYQETIQQESEKLTPKDMNKFMKYGYRSAGESWAQGTVNVLKERFRFRESEHDEFKDLMITGRVFVHYKFTPDGFKVERWSPKNTFFHRDPEIKWAQDGDFAGRVFFTSRAQIIEKYGMFMTREQKEALYPKYIKDSNGAKNMYGALDASVFPFNGYRDYKNTVDSLGFEPLTGQPARGSVPYLSNAVANEYMGGKGWRFNNADLTQVTEGYWRSQCRIGKLKLVDPETGEEKIEYVDETFNAKLFGIEEIDDLTFDEEQPVNSVIWTWKTQIWQGIKVNTSYEDRNVTDQNTHKYLYFNVKPIPFEFKGEFNPLLAGKLPICGADFGKMVVDLLKPYQLLYNVLFNQAYELIQRNNGRFLLMDINYLPTLKDWNGEDGAVEKAMTIAKSMGFMPVDSRLQNTQTANFSNNQVVDLDDTEKITRLINLAMLIEQQAFVQIGITPQRQGQIQASETATGTNAAISNSYSITEPYFENFFSYKKRKIEMMLDMAQFMTLETTKTPDITLRYTTTDLGESYVNVTRTELMLADIGIYADYSYEAYQQLQQARQLAIQNNTSGMPMSKLIDMLQLESLADIKKSLEEFEETTQQNAQAAEQAKMKHEQDMLQMQMAEKQKDRDNAVHIAEIKATADLQKTTLQGIANESSFSQTEDLTDKLIAQRDISLKENQAASQNYLAQQALVQKQLADYQKGKLEKEKLGHDKKLKESEQASKKEIENQKLAQIKEQNKSQERISDNKHKADMALAKEQLKMKELDKEMKLLDIQNAKTKSNLELNSLEKKVKVEENLGKVKVQTIKEIADAKIAEQEKLAKVKSKEIVQSTSLKMEENIQQHQFKLKQNEASHKEKLKQIKIKPKINKKK